MYVYKKMFNGIKNSYEINTALVSILSNMFFQDEKDHPLADEFWLRFIEDDLSDKFLRKIIKTKEFIWWIEPTMEDHYNEILKKSIIVNDKIKLFRAITCNYDWTEKAKNARSIRTGCYWSYSYDGAIPHNGNFEHQKYIFFGEVSLNSVDWFFSILLDLAEDVDEEKEIRLFQRKKIFNFSVETVGEILHTVFNKKVYS